MTSTTGLGGVATNMAPGGDVRYRWKTRLYDLSDADLTAAQHLDVGASYDSVVVDRHFFPSCYM